MKKFSIVEINSEGNIKPLEDSLLFSFTNRLLSIGEEELKTKTKRYNYLNRSKLVKSYLEHIVKMTSNYDRFVKSSLYTLIDEYLATLNINNTIISLNHIKRVLSSLEAKQYKEFLKSNISGVKNPKDKVSAYLQFHIDNIGLLNK